MCPRTCTLERDRISFAEKEQFGGLEVFGAAEEQCPAEGAGQTSLSHNCEKLEEETLWKRS